MQNLKAHFKALLNPSVWFLILPAVLALYCVDPAMVRTMLEWTIYVLVLAGISIIVSMVVFPQVKVDDLIDAVGKGSNPAAIVLSALILFVGIVFIGIVLWAKS
jgi:hypothetical protein